MDWSSAKTNYKNYLKLERGLSENSIQNYLLDIQKLANYFSTSKYDTSPANIDKESLHTFIYEVSKIVATSTQARILSGLKGFFNYLIFIGLRETNPVKLIELPKLTKKIPTVLSLKEIDNIISTIDLSLPFGERNKAIIEILYGCGLRVSEVINLKLSDLFFSKNYIRVLSKGNKQRFVPIGTITIKCISNYINKNRIHLQIKENYEDFVFINNRGTNLTRAMIFTIIKRQSKNANIKKVVSPHTFRHSFATHLLENGADLISIQQMLGHKNITTTEIYIHIDREHLRKIINMFHPRP